MQQTEMSYELLEAIQHRMTVQRDAFSRSDDMALAMAHIAFWRKQPCWQGMQLQRELAEVEAFERRQPCRRSKQSR